MNPKISQKELQQKAKKIEAIYAEYLAKLNKLKIKQNTIINQFIKELEQKKIKEIRKTLSN